MLGSGHWLTREGTNLVCPLLAWLTSSQTHHGSESPMRRITITNRAPTTGSECQILGAFGFGADRNNEMNVEARGDATNFTNSFIHVVTNVHSHGIVQVPMLIFHPRWQNGIPESFLIRMVHFAQGHEEAYNLVPIPPSRTNMDTCYSG